MTRGYTLTHQWADCYAHRITGSFAPRKYAYSPYARTNIETVIACTEEFVIPNSPAMICAAGAIMEEETMHIRRAVGFTFDLKDTRNLPGETNVNADTMRSAGNFLL